MKKIIILATVLNSGEFFSNNEKYIYLPFIKSNNNTQKKNKTKININYNFIFIKNLTNFLILNSTICFFVLINKNSFLYILNRPINHYTTTQCNNSLYNNNLYNNNLYNNNLSISSLDFKKFLNFLKSKLTTDKKYNHFCSITMKDLAILMDQADQNYINAMPTVQGIHQDENGQNGQNVIILQTLNNHYEYLNILFEKILDPVKKKILKSHILKTSKFLENLPLIENSPYYPFYFELSPKKYPIGLFRYIDTKLKTNLFYNDILIKTRPFKFKFNRDNLIIGQHVGLFNRNCNFPPNYHTLPTERRNIITQKTYIVLEEKITFKNLFYISKAYLSGRNVFSNKILGLKHKIGKYGFKYKFHINKFKIINEPYINVLNPLTNKLHYLTYKSSPNLSNYGFLNTNGKHTYNFTVRCSTQLNPNLKGKLLYCLNNNQLWLKLKYNI